MPSPLGMYREHGNVQQYYKMADCYAVSPFIWYFLPWNFINLLDCHIAGRQYYACKQKQRDN